VIELRADCFDCIEDTDRLIDLLEQIKARTENTIVIFTIRTSLEGGNADMPEALYKDVLMRVSAADAVDIIDVEASHILEGEEFINQLHNNGTYVLASHHDFEKTPPKEELKNILDMLDENHDLCTISHVNA
jgi:3-dehydroquinate dehydratase-1